MKENIRHNGIIERIEGGTVYVRILQQSACAGCHARGMCSASDSKVKTVEVTDHSGRFKEKEEVVICGQTALGLQAVVIAFALPIVWVIALVATGIAWGWSEPVSAIMGLIGLIPYYVIVYLMRERLKRKFVFTLEKQENNL
ncbi:SoxR reducing system RseC family protein [Parabacteroides sp. PF5-6]|uniref:SoxR reducing system RseC family protein n=1 Tax=Parabacteroides sp. PF5-6 TaxID=1742403 RepID=UPI0024060F3F|nr:SoxR reducing system RseC family protein [Parabacteroides sp. PF5-6]